MRDIVIQDFIAELNSIDSLTSWSISMLSASSKDTNTLVIKPIGGTPKVLYGGHTGISKLTLEVDLYSETYSKIEDITQNLTDKFNGYSGLLNNNSEIQGITVSSVRANLLNAGDLKTNRTTLLFKLIF